MEDKKLGVTGVGPEGVRKEGVDLMKIYYIHVGNSQKNQNIILKSLLIESC